MQSAGQLIPVSVTVPLPLPAELIVKAKVCSVKVAVTDWAAVIETLQEPVPVQAPDQPVKVEPVDGVAVRVTAVL